MRAGRRLRTEHLDVRSIDSLLSYARVAVVVGKHGHEIVERNRLRRRLRELARTRLIPEINGLDVVIRATNAAYEASFDRLSDEIGIVATKLSEIAG
jgi:ribonuclease P protein component